MSTSSTNRCPADKADKLIALFVQCLFINIASAHHCISTRIFIMRLFFKLVIAQKLSPFFLTEDN